MTFRGRLLATSTLTLAVASGGAGRAGNVVLRARADAATARRGCSTVLG
jgi:hypothetical protein